MSEISLLNGNYRARAGFVGLVVATSFLFYLDCVTPRFALVALGYLVVCTVATPLARHARTVSASAVTALIVGAHLLHLRSAAADIEDVSTRAAAIMSLWIIVFVVPRHTFEAMEQANRLELIGKRAGRIAHNFNNSIGAIMGFAGFLQDGLPKDSEEHDFALRILAAAERSTDLIEEVRKLSRMASSAAADPDTGDPSD